MQGMPAPGFFCATKYLNLLQRMYVELRTVKLGAIVYIKAVVFSISLFQSLLDIAESELGGKLL